MIKSLWSSALGTSCMCLVLLAGGCREEQEGADPNAELKQSTAVESRATAAPQVDLEALARQFQDVEAPDSSRLKAVRMLFEAPADFVVDYYAQRDNARLFRQVIEERVQRRDESVLPLLADLFAHVKGEERIDFEVYLRFGRQSETHLLPLLRAADSGLVLRTLDALGKMQSVAAIDSIVSCLQRDDPWIRMGAAHALGDIGDRRAVGPLVATLQDTAYSVINAALVGLGHLQAVEAYDAIAALIENENVHVRKHAAIALGELGDRRALGLVRQLAEEDGDSGVRFMAGRALKKLADPP